MALPVKYKFRLKNETGVPIGAGEVVLHVTRSKHGPADNAIAYESPLAAAITNAGSIANGAWGDVGLAQDNSVGLFEEGVGTLECAISTPTPSGEVKLVLAASSDTIYAGDGNAQGLLAIQTITSTGAFPPKDFRFR